ncbi:hypothetical protein F383_11243 [Gossypium arboreum]|uniref:Uncharacterized protein n=1 Tax=Gossypium arboreum TaxID=29729 RepID=A0A0B0N9D0_GOSAR|nr:hypothetical protein F383_11243 [Gossypium arboreum]
MTRPKPCHMGSSHARQSHHMAVAHGRVPAEPKLNAIQKRPFLRASRHSKAYKYTLEEEKKGRRRIRGKELLQESRLIHLKSWIYHKN